ncbi:MAG: hypothetical protein IPP72_15740 [Chitinophagaceae bacterium]|nr:hypothetical protein [Chitinophagaceae bacterium]
MQLVGAALLLQPKRPPRLFLLIPSRLLLFNLFFDYKKLNPLLSYAFIVNKPTSTHPKEGDQVTLNMQSVCNNRLMYSIA